MIHSLENNVAQLLKLNPSRRDIIYRHFLWLTGVPAIQSTVVGGGDQLLTWLETTPESVRRSALNAFFEEVALATVAQALVLKSWSDRGIRPLSPNDLRNPGAALAPAIQPFVPRDRATLDPRSLQSNCRYLYSWFAMNDACSEELWRVFGDFSLQSELPAYVAHFMALARRHAPPGAASQATYDPRFLGELSALLLPDSAAGGGQEAASPWHQRKKFVFSPTIREGTLVRGTSSLAEWVGCEENPLRLLTAEMMHFWDGPKMPPLWAVGNALELHSREQLSLGLGGLRASTVLPRIAEMEACDGAVVFEERIHRLQEKSGTSLRLRETIEKLEYFRRLRSPRGSLGDYQACVAMTKLRPGGRLWWAREEPLGPGEPAEVLAFLLERGKLVAEWDLTELSHELPNTSLNLPRFLYLFERETRVQEISENHPSRIKVIGAIRSHLEVPALLREILGSRLAATDDASTVTRGQCTIQKVRSKAPQRTWLEKWPDADSLRLASHLEALHGNSVPLSTLVTIRQTLGGAVTVTESGRRKADSLAEQEGFRIQIDENGAVSCMPLDRGEGPGFLVFAPDREWVPALRHFLESPIIQAWVDQHAERKSGRLVVREQDVKWIPVPRILADALRSSPAASTPVVSLPPDVHARLAKLGWDAEGLAKRAEWMVLASRQAARIAETARGTGDVVCSEQGEILWGRLITTVLPRGECVSFAVHPSVAIEGAIPPHQPILKALQIKGVEKSMVLCTESGKQVTVRFMNPVLNAMFADQFALLSHPTWNELVAAVLLPRNVDQACHRAQDVLKAHGEKLRRLQAAETVITACLEAWAFR